MEAFYAVSGNACLETPDGAKIARGAGGSLVIEAGVPMLLMAIGKAPRRGFALILHDAEAPPTTLLDAWQPQGFVPGNFRRMQETPTKAISDSRRIVTWAQRPPDFVPIQI